MKRNTHVTKVVDRERERFRNEYRRRIVDRDDFYRHHWRDHDDWYRHYWYPWGFYGFYWTFTPIYEIDEYYYDPMVYWFYCDDWDDEYYSTWYGPEYYEYPELRTPFYRVGVFYPTQSFVDLNLGISDLPAPRQTAYRQAMSDLARQLEGRMGVAFDRNDITVDHYQLLDDRAVVVEGTVNLNDQMYAYKALLNLEDTRDDMVFMPTSLSGEPTQDEINELKAMDDRIVQLGGEVENSPVPADDNANSMP